MPLFYETLMAIYNEHSLYESAGLKSKVIESLLQSQVLLQIVNLMWFPELLVNNSEVWK